MPLHEKIAGKGLKQLILKIEFGALMILFWGLITAWSLYNWLTG